MPISNPRLQSGDGLTFLSDLVQYVTSDPVVPSTGQEYVFNWVENRLWRGDGNGGWTEQSINVLMTA